MAHTTAHLNAESFWWWQCSIRYSSPRPHILQHGSHPAPLQRQAWKSPTTTTKCQALENSRCQWPGLLQTDFFLPFFWSIINIDDDFIVVVLLFGDNVVLLFGDNFVVVLLFVFCSVFHCTVYIYASDNVLESHQSFITGWFDKNESGLGAHVGRFDALHPVNLNIQEAQPTGCQDVLNRLLAVKNRTRGVTVRAWTNEKQETSTNVNAYTKTSTLKCTWCWYDIYWPVTIKYTEVSTVLVWTALNWAWY